MARLGEAYFPREGFQVSTAEILGNREPEFGYRTRI